MIDDIKKTAGRFQLIETTLENGGDRAALPGLRDEFCIETLTHVVLLA